MGLAGNITLSKIYKKSTIFSDFRCFLSIFTYFLYKRCKI